MINKDEMIHCVTLCPCWKTLIICLSLHAYLYWNVHGR